MCGKPNGTLWIGASRENVLQSGGASQSSGAPGRKPSKIRAAWEEKLQKPSSLRSRLEEMRESRRDSGRTRESSTREQSSCWEIITTTVHTFLLVSFWMNKGTKWTSTKQDKKISRAAVVGSQFCLEFVQVRFSGGCNIYQNTNQRFTRGLWIISTLFSYV